MFEVNWGVNMGKVPPRSSSALVGEEARRNRVLTQLAKWGAWDGEYLLEFHGLLQVEAWVEYLLHRREVRNPGAYLRRGCADGWPPADYFWEQKGP